MNHPSSHHAPAGAADDELRYAEAGIGDDLDSMLVYNLLRTQTDLGACIDAELRERQLTAAQFNALLVLRAAGAEGLLMGEIGRRLVVTKSNVTGLVDRLERQGLVERRAQTGPDGPSDRRATVVGLTDEGLRLLDRTAPQHAALVAELTGCLTPAEKHGFVELLSKLRRELRRRRKGA